MAGSTSLNSLNSNSASSAASDSVGQYSTTEVADIVGLKATQVRHYVRRDLLSPLRGRRGEFRFTFQDVVMLRSAKELLDADVPVRRANRVLLDLKARNSAAGKESRPLSSLRVQAEGTRVVVQEGNVSWDAESGQGTLPFLADDQAVTPNTPAMDKVAKLSVLHSQVSTGSQQPSADNIVGATDRSPDVADLGGAEGDLITVAELNDLSSDDWYNLALDLEEADPDKAPQAYRRALAINPDNTDAQVNLGRLCQLRGNLKQARRHYKLALESAPAHQLANYNMGTIYDELDEFETARDFYLRATEIPDAHYNLARLFEVRGDELAALRHMREYRRLLDTDIAGR